MAKKKVKITNEFAKLQKKTKKISNHVSIFSRTTQKSQEWIKEMHHELKWMNGDSLYNLLRAVLHALREQLTVNEAAHFSAQLPLILRGTFYEGWNPQTSLAKSSKKDDFLNTIKNKINPTGMPNFEFEKGILITLNVIKKHISVGEIKDIVGMLNPSLKNFIQKTDSQKEASL